MGCGGSKVDDLPLVIFCRERKDLIKTASEHRFNLAAAHVSYIQSLKDIGDALRNFVDEELVIAGGGSSSSPGSPVLTLPSEEGKKKNKKKTTISVENSKNDGSSTSISHNLSPEEEETEGSHLHLSSESDSELNSSSGHIHIEHSPEENRARGPQESTSYSYPHYGWPSSPSHGVRPQEPPYADAQRGWASSQEPPYGYAQREWVSSQQPPHSYPSGDYWASFPSKGVNSQMYYMKRSGTPVQSVVYQEPDSHQAASGKNPDPSTGYSGYPPYATGGFYGLYPMGSQLPNREPSPPGPPPAPPSPPRVSSWDFFNVFDTYDSSGYPGYYSTSKYGYGSSTGSPDSNEIREREGIPDLEDETEQEALKEVHRVKKKLNDYSLDRNKNSGEGTSKAVPSQPRSRNNSKEVPFVGSDGSSSVQDTEIKSSSPDTIDTVDTVVSKSSEGESARKKGVSFEIGEAPNLDVESSKPSSLSTLSVHCTRDLQEVVKEIRDEFESASSYGKEVAVLLEVDKLPYTSKATVLKGSTRAFVFLSFFPYLIGVIAWLRFCLLTSTFGYFLSIDWECCCHQ